LITKRTINEESYKIIKELKNNLKVAGAVAVAVVEKGGLY
jgi:hypothetical protein